MKKLMKNLASFSAMGVLLTTAGGLAGAATGDVKTVTGIDAERKCVYNGFHYTNASNIAPYNHCFNTTDSSNIPPLAAVDKKKTQADLVNVENTSPLNPKNYLGRGSFAYKKLTGNEPVSGYSKEISRTTTEINNKQNVWMTGYNAGGFAGSSEVVNGGENIPLFTVDSSNPYQHYVNVTSNDPRVTSNAKNAQMMTGKIPLPSWYKPGTSGDHSIAIYDVATGIYRSLYYFVANGNGVKDSYTFNSGGYIYANPNFGGMNDRNYWMSLISGTSSVVGLTNELTQIGIDEIKSGKINHAISMTWEDYGKLPSFPAKQADGRVDKNEQPFVPQAGMRFTFPKDFDIDKYAKQNRIDDLTKMIMKAVQEYGGIICDRNFFVNAFNLESPTSYAKYARLGKNAYLADPQLKSYIDKFQSHRFPTDKLQWMPQNYMNDSSSTVKKMEYPVIDYAKTGSEAYQPDALYSTVYQGQYAMERTGSAQQMSPNLMNNTNMYKKNATDNNGLNGEITTGGGKFGLMKDDEGVFTPNANFTGQTDAYYTDNFWIGAKVDWPAIDATGPIKVHRPTSGGNSNGHWIVNVIPKNQPIARSDDGWLVKNTTKSFNVTANDEAGFGQAEKTSGATKETIASIKLLNASDKEVSSYSDGYGTYSVSGKSIKVTAKGNIGYTPIVRYKTVTSGGRVSQTGYLQPLVVSRTSSSPVTSTTPPKTTTPPKVTKSTLGNSYVKGYRNKRAYVYPTVNGKLKDKNTKWSTVSLLTSRGVKVKTLYLPQGYVTVNSNKTLTFTPKKYYRGKVTPFRVNVTTTSKESLNSYVYITVK